jgi:hypothetical protein
MDATAEITMTMTAAEWNQVLTILGEGGPWRIVDPLIRKLAQQGQAQAMANGSGMPALDGETPRVQN